MDSSIKRLLVIEDEENLRDVYKDIFEASGFKVDAFEKGIQGLNALETNSYDGILLDIILPDIHGLAILEKIKKNEKTKHIPVILLTNLSQDLFVKKGLLLGATGYIVKVDYTPDKLVKKVKEILSEPTTTRL